MTTPSVFTVDGVNVSATVTPDWALTQSADKGTAATSGWNLDDGAAAITIPALKDTKVEFGAATPVRAFTGYTIDRGQARNDEAIMGPTATDRRYQINVTDLNSLLSDRIMHGSGGKRPAETDIARITWLLGSPYLAGLVFDNGFIDTANPVAQEAQDFGGQYAYDVLVKCSESSGKNFFVDWDPGAGQATLAYRMDGSSVSRSSDVLISNHAADIDNVNVFAPNEAAQLTLDPMQVYSGIYYQGANGVNAYVRSAANERAFRVREISISDSQVQTVAKAIALSRSYLDRIGVEAKTINVTIKLAIADANRVAAGMRMQVKFTELTGYTSYQWINVNKCTKRPADETQGHMYLDLVLLNLINTGFHGGTTPPGTSNPAPGPPIPPTPPFPIPPCGITDTFDRPDDAGGLHTSDSGRIWATVSGTPEIVSDHGEFTGVGGGSAELPGPWPLPFHGTMQVLAASIPVIPAYTEASTWGPSWDEFNPDAVTTSVNGSDAYMDSPTVLESTFVPVVDGVQGGFSINLVLTPGGSLVGTPIIQWQFACGAFTFIITAQPAAWGLESSPGGPSDPTGPHFSSYGAGAFFYVYYPVVMGVSPFVYNEVSPAIQFDTYAHFIANGITSQLGLFPTAVDAAEMDFDSLSTTVGTSPWGTPTPDQDLGNLSIGGANGTFGPGFFDTNVTAIFPAITDYGWSWTTTGLAADGTTVLTYTAAYLSTGHAPPTGAAMWDPTHPPAFDVPTPLIYVEVTDGVTPARGWTRLFGDLGFPFSPVVDIDELGITLTIGAFSARANNADASLPANGILNAPLLHTEESGLGSAMTFDELNITGVNRCGTVIPSGPVQASTIPLSIDATGSTDVSGPLSDYINAQPAGSVIICPAGATYQCALKLHGLLNVELNGQGCTLQAPAGGFTEDFSTVYFQSFGGSNVNIKIHDFHLIGTSPTPGVFISGHEGQHGILCDGSSNVEIWNIVCEAMYGDFLEVNSGATLIHAHDSSVPNTGRNGLSVIFGNNVEFGPNISLVTMGYMPYDVEPNDASEACFQIYIHGNPSQSWTNAFFAVDGSATGATIHDIEVDSCTSTGYSLLTLVNPSSAGPEQNVTFTNNASNVSAAGPVLTFKDVDGLLVIHNTQALSSGVLVSDPGCTNATISPNP